MEKEEALLEHFGHPEFRPGQEAVIDVLLEGRSALALFPTGAGKSLCYQLPALLLEGLTLVVSPLIALMKDQVEVLQSKSISAARLDSTLERNEIEEIYRQMEKGSLKLLYVAPERLANEGFFRRLRRCKISLLAVDEAHCISEWGHNFRPDYLKLAQMAKDLKIPGVLALTATATPRVAAQICERFAIAKEDHIQTGFSRPNLSFRIHPCDEPDRDERLVSLVKTHEPDASTIVYVTLQQSAERVAGVLSRAGVNARAYHAGMKDEHRAEVQDGFMGGSIEVVVATIAFGMGIDKANIRHVYHYNLPKSLENYVQESGRAGRDGQPSTCTILACADDLTVLENFIYGDTPSPSALKSLVEHVLLQGENFSISRYELSQSRDIRPTVVTTALTYLELDGIIIPQGPFYGGYKVQLLRKFEDVLSGHTPARQGFLKRLFETGEKGWKWHTFDIAESSFATGESEERIRKAIGYLADMGDAIVQPSKLRHSYRVGNEQGESVASLTKMLTEKFESREAGEVERLHLVTELCETPKCLPQQLMAYFGESSGPCGSCNVCEGDHAGGPLPGGKRIAIDREMVEIIHDMRGLNHAALKQPRQLTRFLCGLSSPATTRARLSRHESFGSLQEVPFQDVLEHVEAL
ncbi:MAG: RecQ family ATP-dependent DNA helicase [Verrucomicrobiales bacterium]|nr:RecQ family ATP-dependent DNA helicase [Verrucomicrobiales bacterium]